MSSQILTDQSRLLYKPGTYSCCNLYLLQLFMKVIGKFYISYAWPERITGVNFKSNQLILDPENMYTTVYFHNKYIPSQFVKAIKYPSIRWDTVAMFTFTDAVTCDFVVLWGLQVVYRFSIVLLYIPIISPQGVFGTFSKLCSFYRRTLATHWASFSASNSVQIGERGWARLRSHSNKLNSNYLINSLWK